MTSTHVDNDVTCDVPAEGWLAQSVRWGAEPVRTEMATSKKIWQGNGARAKTCIFSKDVTLHGTCTDTMGPIDKQRNSSLGPPQVALGAQVGQMGLRSPILHRISRERLPCT